ncbi:MAG: ECF transporter S component [Clostridia bacterium]|nr:ECF transporter S component [Clostridia bacterium]MBQ9958222.1 ECF transporter S component [Clostridia bacterium]
MSTKINRKFSFKVNTRSIVMTALLGAVASVLMFFSFSVPFMPSFIKMDLSEMPALVAAFSMGPLSGAAVCLIKNVVNVFSTTTAGVGELCNFLLGVAFVVPAGYIYKFKKNRLGALIGSLTGSAAMAVIGLPLNYFVTYPLYIKMGFPLDIIIGMYQDILPSVDGLLMCLIVFNLPFTLMRGIIDSALTFLIYKRISPLIKGKG